MLWHAVPATAGVRRRLQVVAVRQVRAGLLRLRAPQHQIADGRYPALPLATHTALQKVPKLSVEYAKGCRSAFCYSMVFI